MSVEHCGRESAPDRTSVDLGAPSSWGGRHILEMAVHSFSALGQRGQAEAIAAAGDESEGMMRLRAALASLVNSKECS